MLIFAAASTTLTACHRREVIKTETITIERVDTVIQVVPVPFQAVFDSITETPQIADVDGGRVTIKKIREKVYIQCVPDTVEKTVFIEKIVKEKGRTSTPSKQVNKFHWWLFGAACAVGAYIAIKLLRSPL